MKNKSLLVILTFLAISASASAECVRPRSGEIAVIRGHTLTIFNSTKSYVIKVVKAKSMLHGGFSEYYFSQPEAKGEKLFAHIREGRPPHFRNKYIRIGRIKFYCD